MPTRVQLNKRPKRLKSGKRTTYWVLRWRGSDGIKLHSEALKGIRTKAEAEAARRQKEANLNGGVELVDRPDRMTVAQLFAYHKDAMAGIHQARTTLSYKETALHVIHVLGADLKIDRIKAADAGRLRAYMVNERRSRPATVGKVLTHCKAIFNVAVRDGLLVSNPFKGVTIKQSDPKSARIYEHDEVQRMVNAATSPWWKAYLRMAFGTGLRQGELLSLQWANVDLGARELSVRPQQKATAKLLPWSAKTKSGNRTVPIPAEAIASLIKHRKADPDALYVFLSPERVAQIKALGDAMRDDRCLVNNVLRHFKLLHRAAGLADPVGTVHDLRKSYGTHMAAVVPIHVLRDLMGHSDIATTARFYTRVRASDMELARQAMDLGGLKLA